MHVNIYEHRKSQNYLQFETERVILNFCTRRCKMARYYILLDIDTFIISSLLDWLNYHYNPVECSQYNSNFSYKHSKCVKIIHEVVCIMCAYYSDLCVL
jgi:hypothetical protein